MEEFFALPLRLSAVLLALLGASSPLSSRASIPPLTVAGGPSSDPFVPGARWCRSSAPTAPWIPRSATFVGDGELLWVASAGGTPSLALYAAAGWDDPALPLHEDPGLAGAIGPVRVAAGDDPRELFALAQYSTAVPLAHRRTVTRHDAVAAAQGGAFTPLWSTDLAQAGNGPAYLAVGAEGDAIVAACFDAASHQVRIERLDPATGGPIAAIDLPALALRNLALAADGHRAVVLTGPEAVVLDENLAVVTVVSIQGAGAGASIDATGGMVAVGHGNHVLVHGEDSSGWSTWTAAQGLPGEIVVDTALSADGSVLAVTWWNAANGVDVRCDVLDSTTGATLTTWDQPSPPGALQNYPAALAITPDGGRVAVGVWGVGDARPEVVLLEPGLAAPVLEVDLPGSVETLALDPSGTRIAVGAKDGHANLFATTGSVRLFDTGERDLQLLGPVRPGGPLDLSFAPPPAPAAVFAIGSPLATPLPAPGLGGEIWLDESQPLYLHVAVPDAQGRFWLGLDLPASPSLAGIEAVIQAGAHGGGGGPHLARTVIRPPVL